MPEISPDAAAFRGLVEEHADFVWRSLRRLGVPDGAVDDRVQEVFLTLQARHGDLVPGKERAFLFGIALRVASHARRALARRREIGELPLLELVDPAPSPEARLDGARARALLDDVLDTLGPELRAVFVMSELEEMTMAEIAEVLAIPPGTVASRLRRAREAFHESGRRLRARLEHPAARPGRATITTPGEP